VKTLVANILDAAIQMWCAGVALGGPLITLAAALLCFAPGDYLMGIVVVIALASFFFGLYIAPKMVMKRLLSRLRTRTFYHKLDDGRFLIEEVRG